MQLWCRLSSLHQKECPDSECLGRREKDKTEIMQAGKPAPQRKQNRTCET
jgi:hypothetical protein